MASLASLMEDFRNWRGTEDWKLKKLQDMLGNEDPANIELNEKLMGVGTADIPMTAGGLAGMVSKPTLESLNIKANLPDTELFREAIQNTPGAEITKEGLLKMILQRNQLEEMMGEPSVRGGVFYLPQGSAAAKYYKGANKTYGGPEQITGESYIANPMFVKGATGGKAPETAIDALHGKGTYQKIRDEALGLLGYNVPPSKTIQGISSFLEKYAPEMQDQASYIFHNSKEGNQLPYALQEAAVASALRKAGYDSVLGYSKGKAGHSLSELYDVREQTYPDWSGETEIWPNLYK